MNFILSVVFGWGYLGHTIISELTYRQYNTKPDLDFGLLSVLPDRIKYTKEYAWTRKLHYAEPNDGSLNCTVNLNPESGIISFFKNESKYHFSNKTIGFAVKLHLTQDLFQPLHLSGTHTGGNGIKVLFENTTVNLHQVWDTEIIKKRLRDFHSIVEYVWYLQTKIKRTTFNFDKLVTRINRLNCETVFKFDSQEDLSGRYYDRNIKVIEKLLVESSLFSYQNLDLPEFKTQK
jgi:S1/P1 Nuclease